MKLIFCPECHDIFNLVVDKEKSCSCGESRGKYMEDKKTVEVTENSVVFCIHNEVFRTAILLTLPEDEFGRSITSWALPKNNKWRINK